MYPFHYGYEPVSSPQYMSRHPSYGRGDPYYWQAVAEEEAARRQYEEALREQAEARSRAARARYAQQGYESPYNSYLDDDDDYDYGYAPRGRTGGYGVSPYLSPQEQRALLERQRLEEQRRRLAALEREREQERIRLRAMEEERRRRAILEEQEQLRNRGDGLYSPAFEHLGRRPSGNGGPQMVRRIGVWYINVLLLTSTLL
jgi:hypothetical protein